MKNENAKKCVAVEPVKKTSSQLPKGFKDHLTKRENEKELEKKEEEQVEEEEEEEEDSGGENEEEEEGEGEEEEDEEEDDEDDEEDEEEEERKLMEALRLIKAKKQEKLERKKFRVWCKTNKDPKEMLIAFLVDNYEMDRTEDTELLGLIDAIPYNHRRIYEIETKPKEVSKVKRTRLRVSDDEYKQPINLTNALANGYGLRCLTCKKCFVSKAKSKANEPIPTEIFKQHTAKCRVKKDGTIRPNIVCEDSQRRRS